MCIMFCPDLVCWFESVDLSCRGMKSTQRVQRVKLPAHIYAVQKRESAATVQEHYLMNSIIFQVSKNKLSADDRNMFWNRFTIGDRSRHYYRNRLRVTQSFKAWSATTRLYGYNEVFFLFKSKSLARNRAAFGISSDLSSRVNVDVTYIRQWDRYSGILNLFFLAAIWQFKNNFWYRRIILSCETSELDLRYLCAASKYINFSPFSNATILIK